MFNKILLVFLFIYSVVAFADNSNLSEPEIDKKIDFNANLDYLSQATLSGYTASLMQPYYAQLFKGKTNAEIDSILESFVLKNCKPHQGMMEALIKNWSKRP